jgi:hypothetical protein
MVPKTNLCWLSARTLLLLILAGTLAWGALGERVRQGAAAAPSSPARATSQARASQNAASPASLKAAAGKMPLYFVENRGQTDPRVGYYVQGRNATLYFTPQGVTFALPGPAARQRQVVKLDFVDADPKVKPVGQELTPAVVSYFKGPRAHWQTGLRTYARVVYADLWEGIDLVYSG